LGSTASEKNGGGLLLHSEHYALGHLGLTLKRMR
jgi:hypothetical protein